MRGHARTASAPGLLRHCVPSKRRAIFAQGSLPFGARDFLPVFRRFAPFIGNGALRWGHAQSQPREPAGFFMDFYVITLLFGHQR
jgi:hypothetical protein